MYRGYVKLWRRLQNSSLWKQEKFTRGQAWVDLIMLANHKPGYIRVRGIKVDIDRGQLAHSELTLAKRWKWSRGKVRRFLKELTSNPVQQIEQQKNNLTSLINIINYDQYQSDGTTDGHQTVHQTDTKRYTKRYTNKNDKNVKNDKNDKNKDFDLFWQAYPKKKSKGQARKTWNKIKLPPIETILSSIAALKQGHDWMQDGGKYIPYPSTWLNAEGWEDEPQEYRPDLMPKSISEAERLEERMRGPRLKQEAEDARKRIVDKRNQGTDRPAIPLLPETGE